MYLETTTRLLRVTAQYPVNVCYCVLLLVSITMVSACIFFFFFIFLQVRANLESRTVGFLLESGVDARSRLAGVTTGLRSRLDLLASFQVIQQLFGSFGCQVLLLIRFQLYTVQ